MKARLLSACALVPALVLLAAAQDPPKQDPPKQEPPKDKAEPKTVKAPEGWLFVKPKDGLYRFLFPKDTKSKETSDRTFNAKDISGKSHISQCTLKDGRELAVVATDLRGPALKDMKIDDVYDLMYDADKEPGAKLSEPQEIQVGRLKGREHYVTKKGEAMRVVVVVVRGRVYQLVVSAPTKKETQDKIADTFVTSLYLYPPKAKPKEPPKDKDKEKNGPPGT